MAAVSREECENIYYKLFEIQKIVVDETLIKARELDKHVTRLEIAQLLTQAFQNFKKEVHREYETSPTKDAFAELLIHSHEYIFFTKKNLKGDVFQIVSDNK
ncbi:MAG: hypothetical protein K1060chlam2_00811 [Chlamydiae bacterium]|nr:hypothetical protein [Chlamydiota bacterium]